MLGLQFPSFQLKSNALHIAQHAWSMWLWALAVVFIVLDTAMPFLQAVLGAPDWAFGLASGVFAVGGMFARLLIQTNIAG